MLVSPKSLSVSSTVDLSSEKQKNNRERGGERKAGGNKWKTVDRDRKRTISHIHNMVTDEHMVSF